MDTPFSVKAILFFGTDADRMEYTLAQFRTHNPHIPVLVYHNGGEPVGQAVVEKYGAEYRHVPNLWVKGTRCGAGSFGPEWLDLMFEYGLADDAYTHVLFLETDVYTTKPVTQVPSYDMSGPLGFGGYQEQNLYKHFHLDQDGYAFEYCFGTRAFPHTGCGGTIYSKAFFRKAQANLDRIKKVYVDLPEYAYMDLLMTVLAMISGCTVGDYPETANLGGKYVQVPGKKRYRFVHCDWNTTFVHHIKATSEAERLEIQKKSNSFLYKAHCYLRPQVFFLGRAVLTQLQRIF